MKLTYIIKYVVDMERAIRFYKDQLGFALRFQSPGWSEFETGETTLALHLASQEHPAGTSQLGFGVPDINIFYAEKKENGIEFTSAPTELFGSRIARFKDSDGIECSVSGK
ncbi:MAG: VOC family protein [Ignavibacteria bacterium]|nr:VOC family protein [Ignavibacteria bacterium]